MRYTREEFAERIATATPIQLVIINYELLIYSIDDALDIIYNGDSGTAFAAHVTKAHSFLKELITALDVKNAMSEPLMQIYMYVNGLLMESLGARKADKLPEAKKIMEELLKAWQKISQEISKKGAAGAGAPKGAQTIYSGLTYGRNGMLDRRDLGDINRGYKA